MKKNLLKKYALLIIFGLFLAKVNFNLLPVFAQNNNDLKALNKTKKCPSDVESLGNSLVKNVPSYANRVIQKSSKLSRRSLSNPLYIIVASKPEFEPLPLIQNQYQQTNESEVEQIFFTTLERQYLSKKEVIEIQNYHWLLLTKTPLGWQTVMIFSRFGSDNSEEVISPPKNTTNGIIGQAVNLWLRDCNFYQR